MCDRPAVCGEKLPGRRHKTRGLCQTHADAIFGAPNPLWRRMDSKTQRDIVDEWLRSMTILAHGGERPINELLAEIATVNDISTEQVRLVSPLMPGEARDLHESFRAQNRLRGRETMVYAMVTQILLGWYAHATGQARSDIIQHLALALDTWLDDPSPPAPGPPSAGPA
jgi:hypothetical protein